MVCDFYTCIFLPLLARGVHFTTQHHSPQAAQTLFVIYIRDSIALRLNHLRECMKMVRKSL